MSTQTLGIIGLQILKITKI